MRIQFLSRHFPPVRLGYVTEVNLTERDGENAVQGLGKRQMNFKFFIFINFKALF